jgi:hypothetical protein
VKGRERYEGFIEALGRRLQKGQAKQFSRAALLSGSRFAA